MSIAVGRVVWRVLGDYGKVAAGHGDLVVGRRFRSAARVLVEQLEERLVRVMIEVVDLVSPGQEICHGTGWRFVDDGGRHDIDHVAVVVLDRHVKLGFGVEPPKSRQMDVTTENRNAHREFSTYPLEPVDETIPLLLMRPRRIVIVKVIKKIHASIKAVEEAAAKAHSPVHKLDRTQDWAREDILEPGEALPVFSFCSP